RERVFAQPGLPQPDRARRALGAQGPDPEEKRPPDAPSGWRDVRRLGRVGGDQVVLHPRPATGAARRRPCSRRAAARAPGNGEVGHRKGTREADGPAHAVPRRRLTHGFVDRTNGVRRLTTDGIPCTAWTGPEQTACGSSV